MYFKKIILTTIILLSITIIFAQQKFKVVVKETTNWKYIYSLVDTNGKTIRQLDTLKYEVCFTNEEFVYFAVFGRKDYDDWAAINADEKILFTVYNTSMGEPTPDELIENKIRITDSTNCIGFENNNKSKI